MNQPNHERHFNTLVGRVYDAALEPELWPEVLEDVTTAFDASGLGFFLANGADGTVGFFHSTGIPEPTVLSYANYYAEKNVWAHEAYRRRLPASVPFLSQDWYPEDELERSEFYNDFLRPLDFHHHCGGPIRYDGPEMSIFNVLRSKNIGPFDARHRELCGRLMPHLARAIQIHRQFFELQGAQAAALDVLDHLPMGVLLLDGNGRVAFVNRSAGEIVALSDGLTVDRDGLCRTARTEETAALRNLIVSAAQTGAGQTGTNKATNGAGGALSLPRPSGQRPLAALVAPLGRNQFNLGTSRPAAVLFVADPDRRHEPPAAILARLYGLTPKEAALAAIMMTGAPLKDAADALGVTRNTAHTHLTEVYRKTGTRRQAELVNLLLAGPAGAIIPPRDETPQS